MYVKHWTKGILYLQYKWLHTSAPDTWYERPPKHVLLIGYALHLTFAEVFECSPGARHISSITHSLHNTSCIPIRPPLIVFKDDITLSFLDPLLALIWDKQVVTVNSEELPWVALGLTSPQGVCILVNLM